VEAGKCNPSSELRAKSETKLTFVSLGQHNFLLQCGEHDLLFNSSTYFKYREGVVSRLPHSVTRLVCTLARQRFTGCSRLAASKHGFRVRTGSHGCSTEKQWMIDDDKLLHSSSSSQHSWQTQGFLYRQSFQTNHGARYSKSS